MHLSMRENNNNPHPEVPAQQASKGFKFWSNLAPLCLALAALTFGFDQTIKWWLLNIVNMEERRQITITPFFDLVMAWNKGVSYGLFSTNTQELLIIVSILISIVLWFWACRSHRPTTVAALGMIIGGALAMSSCIPMVM